MPAWIRLSIFLAREEGYTLAGLKADNAGGSPKIRSVLIGYMNTSFDGYYARVSLGFTKKKDTELIAFVRNILSKTAGNAKYPEPDPTLAIVTASVDTFEDLVHKALDGGKQAILARNTARVSLLALMRKLAAYVQNHCNADLVALISSGFDAIRAPSPVGVLPAPQNPRLTRTDKSGELLFTVDRGDNVLNFSIQTAANAEGPWVDEALSSSSRTLIGGLTPGEILWARGRANGTAGSSEWSTPTTAMSL